MVTLPSLIAAAKKKKKGCNLFQVQLSDLAHQPILLSSLFLGVGGSRGDIRGDQ